jgi:anti-sigma factor ChrR (cupin superfamily)
LYSPLSFFLFPSKASQRAVVMQAVALNSGKESGNQAMARLRHELGDDIAEHIGSHHQRMERTTIVRDLLDDENTFLYQQG